MFEMGDCLQGFKKTLSFSFGRAALKFGLPWLSLSLILFFDLVAG